MIYLLLSILSSASIYLVFSLFGKYKVNLLPAITINYLVAALAGLIHNQSTNDIYYVKNEWWPTALVLSMLFISLFYLMAKTTQNQGVSVATNASKMSMIIPVIIIAALYPGESISLLQAIGISIALIGIYLTSKKPDKNKSKFYLFWPLLLFIGTGFLDFLIVYANQNLIVNSTEDNLFTIFLFSLAFLWGLILLFISAFRGNISIDRSAVLGGLILGIINYGSIYFLLRTYASGFAQKTVILPVNNMGIMIVSVAMALIFFKERMTLTNRIGIGLSLLAIAIIFFA
jgi:drug/metabolite transporter (DMT)-like permease